MSIQEGSVDHFLAEVGERLDDTTVSRTADGTIVRARTMNKLHAALVRCWSYLRPRSHWTQLARKITLTEDSENSNRYILPPRVWGVASVEDSNGIYYAPRGSRLRHYEAGFIIERRASTAGPNNRGVVRFLNYDPSATISAWVLEEPTRMSGGDATYTSTTMVLEASPDLGATVIDDDYYNGSQFIITQSGAATEGDIGTATDYVGSTRTLTMPTWSTTPTAQDDYSVLCDLPRIAWPYLVMETVRGVVRVDRRWDDIRNDLREERNETRIDALLALKKPAEGFDNLPRQAEIWVV
jgi:hypothetical protein